MKRENLQDRTKRTGRILRSLRRAYPEADCALHHGSAYELLVATILSAQSTDETVNKVTPALFRRFPTPAALAAADPSEVETLIHATGFFRQKTKSVIGASRMIVDSFGGEVPGRMEDLLKLPGVARKTANVVLGTWFGRNDGIVVDTHVGRIAERLHLCWNQKDGKDAVRIEEDLVRVVPKKDWTYLSHALILHGRKVCFARKPACPDCPLARDCPSAEPAPSPEAGAAATTTKGAAARRKRGRGDS